MEPAQSDTEPKFSLLPGPNTERGRPLHFSCTADESQVSYPGLSTVVLLNANEISKSKVDYSHGGKVTAVRKANIDDSDVLVSSSTLGVLQVSSLTDTKQRCQVQDIMPGHEFRDLAQTSDGKKIGFVANNIGSHGGIYNICTKVKEGTFSGNRNEILTMEIIPNREIAFTAGQDGSIYQYALKPFASKNTITIHKNFVNCMRASSDGNYMVSVSNDQGLGLFTFDQTSLQGTEKVEKAHIGSIYSVAWHPDVNKRQFVTGSADKSVKIWNFESKSCLTTLALSQKPTLTDMQVGVAMGNNSIFSISLGGTLNQWKENKENGSMPDHKIEMHTKRVTHIVSNKSKKLIQSVDTTGKIIVYDEELKQQKVIHTGKTISCAGVVNSEFLLSSYCDVFKLNLETEKLEDLCKSQSGFTMLIDQNSRGIAVDGKGYINEIENNKISNRVQLTENDAALSSLIFTENHLVSGDSAGNLYFCDINKLNLLKKVNFTSNKISSLCAINNESLVFGSNNGVITWVKFDKSLEDVSKLKEKKYHSGVVLNLGLIKENVFYSAGMDNKLEIWDSEEGKPMKHFENCHRNEISCAVQINEQNILLTAGGDASIKGWELN